MWSSFHRLSASRPWPTRRVRGRGCRPCVEALEDRSLLSVTAAVSDLSPAPFVVPRGQDFTRGLASFRVDEPEEVTAIIEWGDGDTSAGTLVNLGGDLFGVYAAGRYDAVNVFSVTVTIQQEGEPVATVQASVVVFDPQLGLPPGELASPDGLDNPPQGGQGPDAPVLVPPQGGQQPPPVLQ